jgi:hypothetical protein
MDNLTESLITVLRMYTLLLALGVAVSFFQLDQGRLEPQGRAVVGCVAGGSTVVLLVLAWIARARVGPALGPLLRRVLRTDWRLDVCLGATAGSLALLIVAAAWPRSARWALVLAVVLGIVMWRLGFADKRRVRRRRRVG